MIAICEECRSTFVALEQLVPSSFRAERLDRLHPSCACQSHSVSEHSAGKVAGTETLIRILVVPQHMDRKGRPKAASLSDAETHGSSMLRESASDDEVLLVATDLVTRTRRNNGLKAGVLGVLNVVCSSIRDFIAEGQDAPCYCVYDTALANLPSHAESFQQVADVEVQIRDLRRQQLFALVKHGFVPVAQFRNGLLSGLAPLL